jgi:hypothetical protein
MTSHDRALGGQLARELSALTERGTRVEITTTEDMTLDELRTTLGACNLRALDAIIATPGGMESLFCLPARTLRKQVETLLDHIATNAPASLHVFLVAVPPLSRIVRMPRVLGFLADQSARVLNRELAAACLVRANATFIPFDAPGELAGRNGSGRTYHRWARVIAPIVTTVLESQARTARG